MDSRPLFMGSWAPGTSEGYLTPRAPRRNLTKIIVTGASDRSLHPSVCSKHKVNLRVKNFLRFSGPHLWREKATPESSPKNRGVGLNPTFSSGLSLVFGT